MATDFVHGVISVHMGIGVRIPLNRTRTDGLRIIRAGKQRGLELN